VLTLRYYKVIFILELGEPANTAIGKRVTVVDYPDSRLNIHSFIDCHGRAKSRPSTRPDTGRKGVGHRDKPDDDDWEWRESLHLHPGSLNRQPWIKSGRGD
jgi:hypothetical protein